MCSALNDLLAPLPAGWLLLQDLHAPGWAWERIYEPLIRRAAGLGRLAPIVAAHAASAPRPCMSTRDVLVIGAGAAGLAAAHAPGRQRRARACSRSRTWCSAAARCSMSAGRLARAHLRGARRLPDGALPHRAPPSSAPMVTACSARWRPSPPRKPRASAGCASGCTSSARERVLIATGALERLIAFAGNDLPGSHAGRRGACATCAATASPSAAGRRSSSTATRPTRRRSRSPRPASRCAASSIRAPPRPPPNAPARLASRSTRRRWCSGVARAATGARVGG